MATGPQLDDLGPHVDPLVGQMIGDRYRLVRRLGAGGMGAVYEGLHTVIGRKVAVKLLHPQLAGDPDTVARFLNEARAAATLGHPNIVEALDMGRAADGAPYLVLEFLQGESLAERLARAGPLTPAVAIAVARQAAGALALAHQKQIVHRDLKPDNLFLAQLLDGSEQVKILDFGVSKFTGSSMAAGTRTGSMVGTPAYMAPEQLLDSSRVDARADVYALGVVLYQSLCGKLPFDADTLPRLAERIAHEPPPPLGTIRPELPQPLIDVVNRCLAKDPAARYGSMEELGQVLASLNGSATPLPGMPMGLQSTAISTPAPGTAPTFITPAVAPMPRADARAPTAPMPPAPAPLPTVAAPQPPRPWFRPIFRSGAMVIGLLFAGRALLHEFKPTPPAPLEKQVADVVHELDVDDPDSTAEATEPAAGTLYRCPASVETECEAPSHAWCSAGGEEVACCEDGRMAAGEEKCVCPPGGDEPGHVFAGCAVATRSAQATLTAALDGLMPAIRKCVHDSHGQEPTEGEVDLSVRVNAEGSVTRAKVTDATAAKARKCAHEVVMAAQLGPIPGGPAQQAHVFDFSRK